MGFPPYFIGLGIPLAVALLGIGMFLFNQQRRLPSYSYENQNNPGSSSGSYRYRQRRRKSFCDDSQQCPICLEDMLPSESTELTCGHLLHNVCLVELKIRNQDKCPKCRANIVYQ